MSCKDYFLTLNNLLKLSNLCSFMEPFIVMGVTSERRISFSLFSDNGGRTTTDRYNVSKKKKNLNMSGCLYFYFGEPLVSLFIWLQQPVWVFFFV